MFKTVFRFAWKKFGVSAMKAIKDGTTVRIWSRASRVLVPGAAITLTYAEGDDYVRDKREGVQHGEGTMLYKDGSAYTGKWDHGKKNGDGTLFTPDGKVRKGYWRNDELIIGTIYYPDGSEYFGTMQNCQPHGKGKMTYKKGSYSSYSGYFKEGKYHGHRKPYVRSSWSSWRKNYAYEGVFKDGKRHGFVLTRDKDDNVISRDIWENDVKVRKLD